MDSGVVNACFRRLTIVDLVMVNFDCRSYPIISYTPCRAQSRVFSTYHTEATLASPKQKFRGRLRVPPLSHQSSVKIMYLGVYVLRGSLKSFGRQTDTHSGKLKPALKQASKQHIKQKQADQRAAWHIFPKPHSTLNLYLSKSAA